MLKKFVLTIMIVVPFWLLALGTSVTTGLPYPSAPGEYQCSGPIPGDPGGPTISSLNWSIHPENSLIELFEIAVDLPASVRVKYYPANGDGEILSTPSVQVLGDTIELAVVRLRPETTYCFQVFAELEGLVSESRPGSFRTGPLPEGLANSSFTPVSGRTTYSVTLLEHNAEGFNGIVALDSQASVVWYYEESAGRVVKNLVQDSDTFNLFYQSQARIKEATPLGEVLATSPNVCGLPSPDGDSGLRSGAHHEVLAPIEDGKVLYLGHIVRDPLDDPNRLQQGDTIRQWDPLSGEDVELWDPFNFLDPVTDRTERSDVETNAKFCGQIFDTRRDWMHSNSIQVTSEASIIMSMRHLNQVISIAQDLQSLDWRLGDARHLGDPTSDFTFPDPNDKFYHQHSARLLPNGNVLLFDNGNTRPEEEGGLYSRALELELDFETMEARKVWEYRHSPDLYSPAYSNVTRLANGNTVAMFGADPRKIFTLVEADDQGNPVAVIEIQAPGKDRQYRAYPVDSIFGESATRDFLCGGSIATHVGTNGSETIVGTSGPDVIVGLDGDDTIRGLGGNDTICAGGGNDAIYGGAGLDRIYGGAGDDTIHGGPDNDHLIGLGGNDLILGGNGSDKLLGGRGVDALFGGVGNDVLLGGPGRDIVSGGVGEDNIKCGLGNDVALSDLDDDSVKGCENVLGRPAELGPG